MRIKITPNGPYIVTGGIPLAEYIMIPRGNRMTYVKGKTFPLQEEYYLDRCGKSSNPPFCDGHHKSEAFHGQETASKKPYLDRIQHVTEGETMTLLDDGRCAFARFCHHGGESVWELTAQDQDPDKRKEAIITASECPSGRLVMYNNDGNILEDDNEPEIAILQDPSLNVSAGILVKGPIIIESADGTEYEVRNRIILCRCGRSQNKPFCDASHVRTHYDDHRTKD